jgi:hypothetical protein
MRWYGNSEALLVVPSASSKRSNAASRIGDLAVPPSNRLEKLRGELEGFYSVRINDQWRVVFRWSDGDASDIGTWTTTESGTNLTARRDERR